jgi:thioredoxin 1
MVKKVSAEQFENEARKSAAALVDFSAVWCGPCRMLAPVVAQIAEEKAGELKVGKVNVDEEPLLAAEFKVTGIPTVMLFKDGKVANKAVGARPKSQLLSALGLE